MTRPKKPAPPLEREFQAWLLMYLAARFPKAVIWRHHAATPGRILSPSKKGMADILMLHKGRMYAFECKRPKEKQLESQVKHQARWERAGGLYMVATGVDEVEKQLTSWGL